MIPKGVADPGTTGLTAVEAAARLVAHGPNELPVESAPTLSARLRRELREPMALLLLVAAALSGVLLGEVVDAIAIVAIVVINAVIAMVQEGRAEHAMAALRALESPTATVVRDGRRQVLDAAGLVPGDLVVVQAGDRVPADLRIVSGSTEVDESILTGESLAVRKRVGGAAGPEVSLGDRDGLMHTGTLVTRGSGEGLVFATGVDTALGAIAARLHDVRRDPTPLQRQLGQLTRRLGGAAVVVAGGAFALTLSLGRDIGADEAFLTAVALAVASVPEGLAAVTTVALALGVGRMARRGAIVRRLPAVETLGAVDVLVIDKTGTVTQNRMGLRSVIGADGADHDPDDLPTALRAAVEPVLVLCNDATADPPTGDPTERALLGHLTGEAVERWRHRAPRLAGAPFTSDRKMMSTVHAVGGRLALLTKGAPEAVLPRCAHQLAGDAVDHFRDGRSAALLSLAHRRASQGERLLALARRTLSAIPEDVEAEEHDLTFIALVALRDPPRTSAAASVAAVRGSGITLLMATGDHPATAAAIAQEVGIDPGTAMTGSDLRRAGLPDDPRDVALYARVDPDQKLQLVTRLQAQGRVVAMTGDGVNDAPALRRADIGVALGATGSDVAREAADLVITDDDLATIIAAVREGRGIYDNLRKVVDYLVTSNLAEVTVVIVALLVAPTLGVPLFPLQLLWINLLTDGLPALALGVDPVDPVLMGRPPRAASRRLLDMRHLRRLGANAMVLAAGGLGGLLFSLHILDLDPSRSRTVLFATLVVAQVLYAFVVRRSGRTGRRPPNRWLVVSVVGAILLQVAIVQLPGPQALFDTASLPTAAWAVVAVAGALAPLTVHAVSRLVGRSARA